MFSVLVGFACRSRYGRKWLFARRKLYGCPPSLAYLYALDAGCASLESNAFALSGRGAGGGGFTQGVAPLALGYVLDGLSARPSCVFSRAL